MTSADSGEAPEVISLTRPPSLAFILLNTNLSHIGDGFRPENTIRTGLMMASNCKIDLIQLLLINRYKPTKEDYYLKFLKYQL